MFTAGRTARVSRIWRTFGLKPHLVDTFKLSKDPQFIEKVRDVVGLYLDPPERAIVLCVDEKSQIQADFFACWRNIPARASHGSGCLSFSRSPPCWTSVRVQAHGVWPGPS